MEAEGTPARSWILRAEASTDLSGASRAAYQGLQVLSHLLLVTVPLSLVAVTILALTWETRARPAPVAPDGRAIPVVTRRWNRAT